MLGVQSATRRHRLPVLSRELPVPSRLYVKLALQAGISTNGDGTRASVLGVQPATRRHVLPVLRRELPGEQSRLPELAPPPGFSVKRGRTFSNALGVPSSIDRRRFPRVKSLTSLVCIFQRSQGRKSVNTPAILGRESNTESHTNSYMLLCVETHVGRVIQSPVKMLEPSPLLGI